MNFFFKILFLGLFSYSAYAGSLDQLPIDFSIQGFKCDKQCFALENKAGERLGVLVPSENQKSTYVLKDAQNEPKIIIQNIHRFMDAAYYNVYDAKGPFLFRIVVEPNPISGGSLYTLLVYELDGNTIKTSIQSNIAGTSHGIYKGSYFFGKDELATLSRPVFTMKTNSQVHIIDREQLFSLWTPPAFAALSAFHSMNPLVELDTRVKILQTRVKNLPYDATWLKSKITSAQFESIATMLNTRFQEQYQDVNISSEESIQRYVNFACDLVESHTLSIEDEKIALLYLRKMMYI